MADTQTAPADTGEVGTTIADALDLVDGNPNLLEGFLDLDSEDTAEDTTASQDQGSDQSDDDEADGEAEQLADDDEAEEDDQATEQSDDESEAGDDFKLFTLDDDGKHQEITIDDLDVPVEVEGEEQLLPLAELKEGYLRQRDYTHKTQEISTRVAKEVEAEREKLSAEFSERSQQIDDIVAVFGASFDQEPTFEQMKARYGGDEGRAWQAMHQWKSFADQLKNAKSIQAKRQEEEAARVDRHIAKTIEQTIKTVRESVPEWKDTAKFEADSRSMRAFMLKNGLNDDDIVGILQSPNYLLLVKDAMYGQDLRNRKAAVTKRRKKAPKTVNKAAGTLQKPTVSDRKQAQLRKRVRSGAATKADGIALIEAALTD